MRASASLARRARIRDNLQLKRFGSSDTACRQFDRQTIQKMRPWALLVAAANRFCTSSQLTTFQNALT